MAIFYTIAVILIVSLAGYVKLTKYITGPGAGIGNPTEVRTPPKSDLTERLIHCRI